ncbi:Stp1/IreP family PP2C-type Ser/Thr phosphatase [Petroclostridium sp. X23]|uniref:Stp1/IreP family PP2C-type Ser/Thr phosphatase n=1 Tax=Petroclostridium sp. X23 TaxID=3045146 RepID=UPI0024AE4251|nr:Stp1/IreP family PP2C-type Ser/Thr phosphatase [Petroclostridium sp. X23]WHH59894.1 Stp1/IreP family PP2C-type Ser/Thr phosphatase [Petroclostridium sp. X23]
MRIGAFTDKGKAREVNEDCFFVSKFSDEMCSGYCIIADGMGGHNAGEVASKMAIDEIQQYIKESYSHEMTHEQIIQILKESMNKANTIIYNKSLENELFSGMGTTAILCFVYHQSLYIAHVGDSRAYIIRGEEMYQITTDHSMVEELISSGSITREEAQNHPQKNVITRALGGDKDTPVDIYIQEYKPGDIILICTDGLTNMLTNSEILSVIKDNNDLQLAVEELITIANDKGGLDNITVVVLGL